MKILGLVWTELRQSKTLALTLAAVSLALGTSGHFAQEINAELQRLVRPEHWSADLAILPKGLSLSAIASELRTGDVKEYLPEALYHTTSEMTRGELQLSAVLPLHEQGAVVIAHQGDARMGFAGWGLREVDWRDQQEHATNEWGAKVIAAAFASGPTPSLEKLKELIDRKTIAQAVWIDEAQKAAIELQTTLSHLASALELILLASLLVSLILAGSLYLQRHQETQRCLRDLGWSRASRFGAMAGLAVTLLVAPLIVGYGLLPPDAVASHMKIIRSS